MVKLRFRSLVLPGSGAKESRVKAKLEGFTCNVFPDFSWISELTAFIKSPPGVSGQRLCTAHDLYVLFRLSNLSSQPNGLEYR
jgi:hypothetical protein